MSESLNDIVLNEEDDSSKTKKEKKHNNLSKNQKIYLGVLSGVIGLIVVVGGLFIFNNAYFAKVAIDGIDMYPTLNSNVKDEENNVIDQNYSKAFTDKMRVEFGIFDTHIDNFNLERFKIYAFKQVTGSSYSKVRRLIGLPGETISYRNNVLYVNETKIDEVDYANGKFDNTTSDFTVTLSNKTCYFLGDNRNNTTDSRTLGPIDISLVYGKLVAIEGTCETSGGYLKNLSYSWPRFI